ncbi:MAG TPA: trigger factor, partial [Stenomitos sp.]
KRYTEFDIKAEEVPYDEAEVERVINEQRSARSTLIPVEGRSAQAGDVVQIDFSGQYFLDENRENSQEVEGGSATDFQLELTEGQFIAGFTEGIIGMNPDETKEIEVQFPADYPVEELKGKAAVFTVTLKEIKTKELPELDDSFAQEVSEFETLAELRQFLEERYRKEAQDKTDANVEDALIGALVAELEVDLPETLISNEVNFLINQMAQRFQSQGIDVNKLFTPETIPSLKERFREEAAERVKRTLALAQVAKVENLTVLPEAVEKRFQEIVTQLNDRNIDRARLKEVLEDELLQEKVIEWLKERSQISLVEKVEPVVDAQTATLEAKAETVETEEKSSAATKTKSAPEAAEETSAETKAEEKKKTTRRSRTTKSKAGENKDEA